MATVKFQLRTTKNPARIYVRVKEGNNAVDVKVGTSLYINPVDWSKDKGKPRLNNADLKQLDNSLTDLWNKIIKAMNNRASNEVVNNQWVKDIITPPPPPEKPEPLTNELVKYFDIYINELKAKLLTGEATQSSITKYSGIKKLLEGMEKARGAVILIQDVNLNFKKEFHKYCLKNGYAPNTIGRAIKFIKTVVRDARANGLETHKDLDHKDFKGITHKTKHIHLTFEDLDKIESTELEHDYLDNARDWLIISCYTGQRVSDFLRFNKSMIRTKKEKQLVEFTQVKTGKIMAIPVHDKVKEILDKRNGEFPRKLSDQRYNEYIKEVCKLAGLTNKVQGSKLIETAPKSRIFRKVTGTFEKWELVASHIGRRSFLSNFYGEVPTSVLKAISGHSSEIQLLAYIGKSDTEQAEQITNYW